MNTYLISHAMQNTWCDPQQDNLVLLTAQRITRSGGEIGRMRFMGRQLQLPDTIKNYHVFHVGQVFEDLINLQSYRTTWELERWVPFTSMVNDHNVLITIYNAYGRVLPLHSSYYMFTNEKALIYVVPNEAIVSVGYSSESLYLRLYKNAYFQTTRASEDGAYMRCNGLTLTSKSQFTTLMSELDGHLTEGGAGVVYVNGDRVNNYASAHVNVGDIVEYVYDGSVKRVLRIAASGLRTFTSTLDGKSKYIIRHTGSGQLTTIDFQDDIDVFVLYAKPNGTDVGRYYHRNRSDSHRMLTHRDYSVVVEYVNNYIADLRNVSGLPTNSAAMYLEVQVREGGYARPLWNVATKTHELYRLSSSNILDAMTGIGSTVGVWQASALESSASTTLMRAPRQELSVAMVEEAYGYNSIAQALGSEPVAVPAPGDGTRIATVPVGLQTRFTAYEYDADGVLLEYHPILSQSTYIPANEATRTVEFLYGIASPTASARFGNDNVALATEFHNRVYVCNLVEGVPTEVWYDITGSDYYHVENGIVIWNESGGSGDGFYSDDDTNSGDDDQITSDYNPSAGGQYLMVRDDSCFVVQDLLLDHVAGTFYFSLAEFVDRGEGLNLYLLRFPSAQIEVFLNGRSLVRNIDFVVEFPKVYIVNKTHLNQPAATTSQWVHVRLTGFPDTSLHFDPVDDVGYMQHGLVSCNGAVNLRNDKVMRYSLGGFLTPKNAITFSEDSTDSAPTDPSNGTPYQAQEILVTPFNFTTQDLHDFRRVSRVIDTGVAAHLSAKLPEPVRATPTVSEKYPVVSPFFCHILNDLNTGQINESFISNHMSDEEVTVACLPYIDLIDVDPVSNPSQYPQLYVDIIPHGFEDAIQLSYTRYYFYTRVVELYGQGRIQLDDYVVEGPGFDALIKSKYLFVGLRGGSYTRLYNTEDWTYVSLAGITTAVRGADFSPQGNKIAVGVSGAVKIYSLTTGSLLATISIAGGGYGVKFSPDGQELLIGTNNNVLRYNAATYTSIATHTLSGASAYALDYSPNGRFWAVSVGSSPTPSIKVFDRVLGYFLTNATYTDDIDGISHQAVKFSSDSKLPYVGNNSEPYLTVYRTSDWSVVDYDYTFQGEVYGLDVDVQTQRLFATVAIPNSTESNRVIFHAETMEFIQTLDTPEYGEPSVCSYDLSGQAIAVGGTTDGSPNVLLKIYRTSDWSVVDDEPEQVNSVSVLKFSPS